MVDVRPNPANEPPDEDSSGGGCGGPERGCRLNLLLSYAGWHAESWADRLPRLLEPMGIRAVRASSGRQATQVIASTPIHIAVVDLGLPLDEQPAPGTLQEGGPRLLELLSRLSCPPPTVVVKRARTHRDDGRDIAAALRLGAFAVIDRPHGTSDLEILLDVMRRALRRYYQGRWPGMA